MSFKVGDCDKLRRVLMITELMSFMMILMMITPFQKIPTTT